MGASESSSGNNPKKQKIKVGIGILGLFILLIGGVFAIETFFPDNHGHNRAVLFIRSDSPANNSGYYIIDDEIFSHAGDVSDLYFYGLGNTTITGNSVEWWAGDIGLNLTVLMPEVELIPISGKVYRDENTNFSTQGVKIHPTSGGNIRIISLFYPRTINSSFLSIQPVVIPGDTDNSFHSWQINSTDFFGIPQSMKGISQTRGTHQKIEISLASISITGLDAPLTCTTHRLFYRLPGLNSPSIVYSYGTAFSYRDSTFESPDTPQIALWTEGTGQIGLKSDDEAGIAAKTETKSTPAPDTANRDHPFLYLNNVSRTELLDRITQPTSGPWADWYSRINSLQWNSVLDKALKAFVDNNLTWAESAIVDLLNITYYEPFRQNLNRGSFLVDYMAAYDFLWNYMTPEQRSQFEADAFRLTYPCADARINNVMPLNNHKIVSLVSYGMLGLVTGNQSMIQLMQDQIDDYLTNEIRRGGICYEGPSYAEYTFRYAARFMFALKNAGGFNYFADPSYLDLLNFTVRTRAPDGTAPLFEDSHEGIRFNTLAAWSISQVEPYSPLLAAQLRWYVDAAGGYSDIWDSSFTNQLTMLTSNLNGISPDTTAQGSYIYFEGGYAGLGTGPNINDTMLVISNKNYMQSHAHYDENSFELWAYGKKILTNAGYPHYGGAGHAATIATEGNNAVVIGGHPQYLIESDGFDTFIATSQFAAVESPCFIAYEHPLSFAWFPWWQIFAVIGLLGVLSILLMGTQLLQGIPADRPFHPRIQFLVENKKWDAEHVKRYEHVAFITAWLFHSIGFALILFRSNGYMAKAIEHIEAWPDVKALLSTALKIAIPGLTIAAMLITLFQHWWRKRQFEKVILPGERPQGANLAAGTATAAGTTSSRVNMVALNAIMMGFYMIWALLFNIIVFNGFHQLQTAFFTMGSTVQNALVQVLTFIQAIWRFWLIMLVIRWTITGFTIRSTPLIKGWARRDFVILIIFSALISALAIIIQRIPIEFTQSL